MKAVHHASANSNQNNHNERMRHGKKPHHAYNMTKLKQEVSWLR